MSHSGKDELVGPADQMGIVSHNRVNSQVIERLFYRRQIAGLVIDDRDHSSPFVLGSIFWSRLSREQANRSARAKALNSASSL